MTPFCGLLLWTGLYPLYRAWRRLAGSPLRHSLAWAGSAWLTACLTWSLWPSRELRYLALCLGACAGVAVLGARRPGVAAWNLVVAGLLAALCRPYLEGLGELRLEGPHLVFLGGVLVVVTGNYLPTRRGAAAGAFALWTGGELAELTGTARFPEGFLPLALAVVPWLSLGPRRGTPGNDLEVVWREFRDAFGFLWGQRVREQFNRAAANAGLPLELRWTGVRERQPPTPEDQARAGELLRSLLRRFSPAGEP